VKLSHLNEIHDARGDTPSLSLVIAWNHLRDVQRKVLVRERELIYGESLEVTAEDIPYIPLV
jgi:hypothetical protein